MTVREFLKSKTFQALAVLVIIALISGGILAILHDVLKVNDYDRMVYAIKNIYGKKVNFTEKELFDEDQDTPYGRLDGIYALENGDILFKTTGKDGFKGGSVSLWIVAEFKESVFRGLGKITVAGNEKQTLMSSFGSDFFTVYYQDAETLLNGGYFSIGGSSDTIANLVGGATLTSVAINNAVNVCIYYLKTNSEVANG